MPRPSRMPPPSPAPTQRSESQSDLPRPSTLPPPSPMSTQRSVPTQPSSQPPASTETRQRSASQPSEALLQQPNSPEQDEDNEDQWTWQGRGSPGSVVGQQSQALLRLPISSWPFGHATTLDSEDIPSLEQHSPAAVPPHEAVTPEQAPHAMSTPVASTAERQLSSFLTALDETPEK